MFKWIIAVAAVAVGYAYVNRNAIPSDVEGFEWVGMDSPGAAYPTKPVIGSKVTIRAMLRSKVDAIGKKYGKPKDPKNLTEAEEKAMMSGMSDLMEAIGAAALCEGTILGFQQSDYMTPGTKQDYAVVEVTKILEKSMDGTPDIGDYVAVG